MILHYNIDDDFDKVGDIDDNFYQFIVNNVCESIIDD